MASVIILWRLLFDHFLLSFEVFIAVFLARCWDKVAHFSRSFDVSELWAASLWLDYEILVVHHSHHTSWALSLGLVTVPLGTAAQHHLLGLITGLWTFWNDTTTINYYRVVQDLFLYLSVGRVETLGMLPSDGAARELDLATVLEDDAVLDTVSWIKLLALEQWACYRLVALIEINIILSQCRELCGGQFGSFFVKLVF